VLADGLQSDPNGFDNIVGLFEHFLIPEAQDAKAL
jgi:hypothetical protein